MQDINWSRGLDIEVRGNDVVSHTGSVMTRILADKVGLTTALSATLTSNNLIHDRGRVFTDLAVTIADGGTSISDIDILRNQKRIFGSVASTTTAWRTLDEINPDKLAQITVARNEVREKVWTLISGRHGSIPPTRTAYGNIEDLIVIRIDATLVDSYSEKDLCAGNFKGGYGFHPLTAWCDNTGECLAIIPRAGNAGSNTAADHIAIIDAAIAAIPEKYRHRLLVTIDGAGSSHGVLEHLTALDAVPGNSVEYSVGFGLDSRVRAAITDFRGDDTLWSGALDAKGQVRDDAQIADLTGLLRESYPRDLFHTWPAGMRILVRREPIAAGTQLSVFEQDDKYRYQPLATNTSIGQIQKLEARHRSHARVEGFIRTAKDTGLAKWPSKSFAVNSAWVMAVAIACDLLAWTRLLLLDGELASAEPQTLRYRLLHTGARIIKSARKQILRISETWPWAHEFTAAFTRVLAIP